MNGEVGEAAARSYVRDLGVSRETLGRLETYVDLLLRWTRRVNLISASTADAVWTLHILDSVQIWPFAPHAPALWLDLGSGGGLPGIVCAILAADLSPKTRMHLVESDRRKSAFLMTCLRELDLDATVHACRIENLSMELADVISARAVAPLPRLFELCAPHAAPSTVLLFPKGARYAEEIEAARSQWRFTADARPSITDPAARILRCHLQGGT